MGNNASNLSPRVTASLTQETGFSAGELKEIYRHYKHDCNSGQSHGLKLTLNKSEFKAIYTDIFPEGDAGKFAEHIFRTYDKEKKGTIDFKEFVTMLNIQFHGTYEDKLVWLFDLYDVDNSDDISYDEAYEIINILYDLNSGLMPDAENNSPKELTEYLFKKANERHNGKVVRQFFYGAAQQSDALRTLLVTTVNCANRPFSLRKEQSVSFHRNTSRPDTGHDFRNRSSTTYSSTTKLWM